MGGGSYLLSAGPWTLTVPFAALQDRAHTSGGARNDFVLGTSVAAEVPRAWRS